MAKCIQRLKEVLWCEKTYNINFVSLAEDIEELFSASLVVITIILLFLSIPLKEIR